MGDRDNSSGSNSLRPGHGRRASTQYGGAALTKVSSHKSLHAMPFHDETSSLSTRGQHLPFIIQAQLADNLKRRPSELDLERADSRSQIKWWEPPKNNKQINVSGDGRGIDLDDGFDDYTDEVLPTPPVNFPMSRVQSSHEDEAHRASIIFAPQIRSQRLIGNSNPRYLWARYYKSDEELAKMPKKVRKYYERNNFLIMQYDYIDRLLDSSVPHDLIQEYGQRQSGIEIPPTIEEHADENISLLAQSLSHGSPTINPQQRNGSGDNNANEGPGKVQRTKKLYKLADESTPLLGKSQSNSQSDEDDEDSGESLSKQPALPAFEFDEDEDSGAQIVTVAIYVNLIANAALLILKIVVTVLTSSLSVLASLVDAALDFLSTAIVWTTARLISAGARDKQNFPVGRQRLEPLGVLVFSVIMITSFVQVGLEAIYRLTGPDREVVQLTIPAIAIMASTVVVKGGCWAWCRLIKNSSVQALAQDAVTDVVFNIFSIIFPLVGYYAQIWWLDPLGGLLLSFYVIISWSLTTRTHILNLTGHAASADQRNILLYLTMRFAHTIRKIQDLSAYHAGDKLIVEVDVVLDEDMSLKDSHDLGESLQYVIESVPGVERAFVHTDYNEHTDIPTHMNTSGS